MTRLGRRLVLLSLIFPFFFPGILCAQEAPKQFLQALRKEVAHATRKRLGIVVWMDLEAHTQLMLGDAGMNKQKFRPGSVFKLLTAEAALKNFSKTTYFCQGHDRIGGKTRFCWKREGHGWQDLAGALAFSCNLYFSQLGELLGYEALREEVASYEFLDPWPDLAPEKIPSELPLLSIGDSSLFHISPEQMTQFWDRYLGKLTQPSYAPIRQGLERAANEGTALAAKPEGLEILAKTGTADSEAIPYKTDAWLLAAYPAEGPRYALVILLQEAYGFREPARLAGKIFSLAEKFQVLKANP